VFLRVSVSLRQIRSPRDAEPQRGHTEIKHPRLRACGENEAFSASAVKDAPPYRLMSYTYIACPTIAVGFVICSQSVARFNAAARATKCALTTYSPGSGSFIRSPSSNLLRVLGSLKSHKPQYP
jgi:hypothetical protein